MQISLQQLSHEEKGLRKEAAWTISNVTAGTLDQASCTRSLRQSLHSFLSFHFLKNLPQLDSLNR